MRFDVIAETEKQAQILAALGARGHHRLARKQQTAQVNESTFAQGQQESRMPLSLAIEFVLQQLHGFHQGEEILGRRCRRARQLTERRLAQQSVRRKRLGPSFSYVLG